MAMGALDCPICYEPLVPPIYQCAVGHLICKSCRASPSLKKCPLCPRTSLDRCFGLEQIVESMEVSCCFAKYGCNKKIAYVKKLEHEKECQHGRCFCPERGCGFTGTLAALRDHFSTRHKWPSTSFKYYTQFDIRVQPGPHVLHAQDGKVFLVNMALVEPLWYSISLVHIQAKGEDSKFGCSVVFSCFTGHHQISSLDAVRSSSLSDGLPKDFFCVVPRVFAGGNAVLKTTIDTKLMHEDGDKLEEDDDEDESYDEDEDDDEEDGSDDD